MMQNEIHGTTLGVYSLFDVKTNVYLEPFYAKTTAEANRTFLNAMFKIDAIRLHSQDYDLRYLGLFDTALGEFISTESPRHVVNGLHLYTDYNQRMSEAQNEAQKRNDPSIQSSPESGNSTE